jgi:hypothetical protein
VVQQTITDGQFVDAWQRFGSPQAVSDYTGLTIRRVYARRDALAKRGIRLETRGAHASAEWADNGWTFPREKQISIDTGSVIISSDHHYWPGEPSLAHRALLTVIDIVKPRVKILNGDVFDGGSVGRHPPFGWSKRPTAADELHAAQERVHEIEKVLPNGCERLWNIGNHDIRFERNLAMQVPDYAGIEGFRLGDHFHGWDMNWSTAVNWDSDHPVMVKHRNAGGVHAGYNNAMKGGVTIVTGHTHRLECKPWGNYRCNRYYGIQSGTLADLHAPQFEYHENGPTDACPGFVVLTFKDGELLPPELCEVRGDRAYFRSEVVAEDRKEAA